MNAQPLRTSVIGSYPVPGWLEFVAGRLYAFGRDDLEELQEDAAMVAIQDQLAVGPRRYAPLFPAFLDLHCDEMHVELASREYAELEVIAAIAARMDVAVGGIDGQPWFSWRRQNQSSDFLGAVMRISPALAGRCTGARAKRWTS